MWPYVVLDLETAAGKPTEAEDWMRRTWHPDPRWQPETIGRRFVEAYQKKCEQLALVDTAPIITVALRTPAECRVVHWLPTAAQPSSTIAWQPCGDEAQMLAHVAAYLTQCSPDTLLVGHNVLGFDLRRLRRRMLEHGISLPPCLIWRDHPVFDSAREWSRFSLDERPCVPLEDLLIALHLPDHKAVLDGKQIPELYAAGHYEEILLYAALDVLAEHTVFLRMTGGAFSLDAPPLGVLPNITTDHQQTRGVSTTARPRHHSRSRGAAGRRRKG